MRSIPRTTTCRLPIHPIKDSIKDCIGYTPLINLNRLFAQTEIEVVAKLEYMNPGGSIKDRPARFIIEQGIREGAIQPGKTQLIESTSGNFGIAIAMIAKIYGLKFICVVDPKITKTNLRILEQLGACIEMVKQPDEQGGYLKTRIQTVEKLVQTLPHGFWLNQYANQCNWEAYYYGTGDEVLQQLDRAVDYLVAAVSTTGSILGCARRFRTTLPDLKVIAVDAVGSVIFGSPAAPRELPGIGSSRVPEILSREEIDKVVYVSDYESAQGCRDLLHHEGILAGGSSGSVIAGIQKILPVIPAKSRIATIFPDRGERYLDTVYDDQWMAHLNA
ncbi:MAG: 2,3-diaminopropionate biosynthesis protein SbnA [Cyanobacteria bacterium SW_12_48_29]|nr:MAG: 2,3-diaminopropionate biosynthesis protein SbnA [Cyanobacteria bacterium QS_6_48_18]PSO97142.1 MAG: 2,3-diaminopropionate biosynthesis protein SbnA [Cyanobacteria bacterium SW_12_48_29]PSP07912.1 MAG: 2,3-diaminopropionate biosynthesis protein SbnA [Cyanobacteria bacterium SW_10_48_33]PSP25568.1 MAG: 2,3-diaminopropionate biosynthesis protein SbnA [Cyanobacteria bacterium SW_5_48_44]